MPFFERELTAMGMHLNPPGKTVVLAPKGHVPTPEEISHLAGIGVRNAHEGRIKVVGVPVGTGEFAIKSVIGIVRDGRAEPLARMLPRIPDIQAANPIATGSIGMSSAEARRMSASGGSLVATPPAVLADLSGSLGDKVRRNLPESELVTSIWEGIRGLRDNGGVTEEDMGNVASRGWRDRAFRPEEVSASGNSDREVLAARDAETINSHQAQKTFGKQANLVRYDRYVTPLDERSIHPLPPEQIGPFGESQTSECAKARKRNQSEPGAAAWLSAKAGGRITRHTSLGVPVRRTATSGD